MATFHPFPRLPYELRAQVWEMTVEPRVVNVEVRHRGRRHSSAPFLTSSTTVPAVLQVCREARNYGLYEKAFSEIANPGKGLGYVWANLEIDIIDIGESYFLDFDPIAPTIRRLRIEREMSSEFFYHSEVRELHRFVNVMEIYVVCADGLYSWLGALEEHYWPCGEENVFFIDPDDGEQVFRGPEGLDKIADMEEQELQERELYEQETQHEDAVYVLH